MKETIVVYTDGGCSQNPGPGGWGCVIIDGKKKMEFSGGEKMTTNNRMELSATICALKKILENKVWKRKNIAFFLDSQYVKNGITLWIQKWKENNWLTSAKKQVLNKDLWLELDTLCSQLEISWHWVRAHSGNEFNERCDKLCKQEIAKFLELPLSASETFATAQDESSPN